MLSCYNSEVVEERRRPSEEWRDVVSMSISRLKAVEVVEERRNPFVVRQDVVSKVGKLVDVLSIS